MVNSSKVASHRASRCGGGWVCWMLMLMGLATFAPSILLSEWREYQALKVAQQREEFHLANLQDRMARERRSMTAMQTDPAVVARLVRRDLHFHNPSEKAVPIAPVSEPIPGASPFVPQPVNLPAWLAAGERYLPGLNYDGVFCDEQTRRLVLGLSLAILVLSAVLAPRGYISTP